MSSSTLPVNPSVKPRKVHHSRTAQLNLSRLATPSITKKIMTAFKLRKTVKRLSPPCTPRMRASEVGVEPEVDVPSDLKLKVKHPHRSAYVLHATGDRHPKPLTITTATSAHSRTRLSLSRIERWRFACESSDIELFTDWNAVNSGSTYLPALRIADKAGCVWEALELLTLNSVECSPGGSYWSDDSSSDQSSSEYSVVEEVLLPANRPATGCTIDTLSSSSSGASALGPFNIHQAERRGPEALYGERLSSIPRLPSLLLPAADIVSKVMPRKLSSSTLGSSMGAGLWHSTSTMYSRAPSHSTALTSTFNTPRLGQNKSSANSSGDEGEGAGRGRYVDWDHVHRLVGSEGEMLSA